MRTRRALGIAGYGIILMFLVGAAAPIASAQLSDHISIKIRSKWVGLGAMKESSASVEQRAGRCYVNGKLTSAAVVETFLRELAAAAETPSLANLGINKTWLEQNATPAFADHANDQPKVERNNFLTSFRNVSLVESLLPQLIQGGWTDDYPTIEVKIERNGKTTLLSSKRQNVFMVPFEINEGGTTRQSYNAKLAQALVAFLPTNFTNLDRLSGKNLRSVVAEKVIDKMRSS